MPNIYRAFLEQSPSQYRGGIAGKLIGVAGTRLARTRYPRQTLPHTSRGHNSANSC